MRAHRWIASGPGGLSEFEEVEEKLREPEPGEVLITVQAAGVNPADLKHAEKAASFPHPIGYEVAGIVTALGRETTLASGGGSVGDAVLAFRVSGGYATKLLVPAEKVFARPDSLDAVSASTLLLAATTAADMLHVARVESGETIALFGASGAVGSMVLQLARARGMKVIGVVGEGRSEAVARYGGVPVERGAHLAERMLQAAGDPIAAVLDAAGSEESIDVGGRVVADNSRKVTIVGSAAMTDAGFTAIGGTQAASAAFRDSVRADLIAMAGAGDLVVDVARTFPLTQAREALELVAAGKAGGKVALVPEPLGE